MLEISQIFALFKHIFNNPSYGESLEQFIVSRNPKNSADVESLERQWVYRQNQHTGGGQWL